jgi:hypothetical protein
MVCDCKRCVLHFRTLGLDGRPTNSDVIKEAYRDSVKIWHPDRFESDPRLRLKAEEQFKRVQVAYRELTEHESSCGDSTSRDSTSDETPRKSHKLKTVPIGDLSMCFAAPSFPPNLERRVRQQTCMGHSEEILGIVDLSRTECRAGDFSQFFLLSNYGIWVNDGLTRNSFLAYGDVGILNLIDHRDSQGKIGWFQRQVEVASGNQQKLSLEVKRQGGSHYFTLSGPADDKVKVIINDFILKW